MARKLIVELVGDSRQLDRTLGRTETRLQKFGRVAGATGLAGGKTGLGGFLGLGRGTAITAGVGAGVLALKNVTDAATNAQVILGQTSVALTDAGLSWEKYGKQVQTAALSISRSSAFDDEEVLQSFAVFVRGQKDVAKSLVLSQLAADVARGRYTDLATATQLVNKASFGQIGALRRAGINIDKNATSTEALTALTKAYGGAAEKYANSAAGAQDKLRVSVENLREELGANLLPALTGGVIILNKTVEADHSFLSSVKDAAGGVKDFADKTHLTNILLHQSEIRLLKTADAMNKLGEATAAVSPLAFGPNFGSFTQPSPTRAAGAPGPLKKIPVGPKGGIPSPLITTLPNTLRNQEADARLSGNKAALKAVLAREAQALQSALKDPRLRQSQKLALKQELLAVTDEIRAMDEDLIQAAKDKRQAAIDARKKAASEAAEAKKKLAAANKALLQKFKDQADAIKSAVLDAFDTKTNKISNARALADAKAALRVALQIGGAQGIKLARRDVTDAQRAIQRQRLEDTTFRVGQGPKGPVNAVSVGTMTFNIRTSDPEAAAREVLKILNKRAAAPQARGRNPGRT